MKKHKNNNTNSEIENIEDIAENSEAEILEEQEENTAADNMKADIEALQKDNAKLKEDYLRAYADLENTKKRCAQEIEKNSKYAISSFAKELLSVADNLQRALDAAGNSDAEQMEHFRKGVELTESELMKVLGKFGVTKMEAMGKVFNPSFHQVVQEVEDKTKPAGTIIAELQTGYMINDRLLREAMVVVSK
ncbi:MAG: nucleotide exchange factor GrpE [Azospirillum sp.]|nr:nucleotide exchange factor GrpE [Azospirillum sp.]